MMGIYILLAIILTSIIALAAYMAVYLRKIRHDVFMVAEGLYEIMETQDGHTINQLQNMLILVELRIRSLEETIGALENEEEYESCAELKTAKKGLIELHRQISEKIRNKIKENE